MNLWQQLRDWWRHDRIRTSPSDGKLLRLEQGCCLVIEGQSAVVRDRRQEHSNEGPMVRYTCDLGTETGELCVGPLGKTTPRVTWQQQEIDATSIEIYAPGASGSKQG